MPLELKTGEATTQQKVILGILAVIGFIYFYSNVFAPMSGRIQEAEEELQSKNRKVTNMQIKAGQLDALEKEFELLTRHLEKTERHLPRTEELPEFIKTITRLAERFDMEVKTLSVGESEPGDYYRTHPYSMQLSGDYHTLGQFFARLGQLERIFSVKDLSLSTAEDNMLRADFDIVAYTFRD